MAGEDAPIKRLAKADVDAIVKNATRLGTFDLIKTMNKIVRISKMKIAKIINVETAPVLPNSKVVTRALGISATIPAKIISDIPFPMPLWVICSPSHIKKIVPATIVVTVEILKKIPGLITKLADDSSPTARP